MTRLDHFFLGRRRFALFGGESLRMYVLTITIFSRPVRLSAPVASILGHRNGNVVVCVAVVRMGGYFEDNLAFCQKLAFSVVLRGHRVRVAAEREQAQQECTRDDMSERSHLFKMQE